MISKTRIGIILASAMLTSAMVCYGIVTRHHESAPTVIPNPQVEQIPAIPKPSAGKPLDTAADSGQIDAANDSAQQATDPAADPNQTAAPADQADAGNSNPGDQNQAPAPAVTAQRQLALSATAVTPTHSIARVKVVRVAHPLVAAASVAVDRPVASITAVLPSAIVIPAGSPLTLRLTEPLGSKISQVDQSFAATLDRDIDVHGRTVIPSGARVTGKVVNARPAGRLSGEATLQLEVTSVKVNHHELEVKTSVRSFGPNNQGKNKFSRFMKGIAKRIDGQEHEVLLEDQTAYTFNLSGPLQIQ